jgi:rod shape-determining protein MreC
MESVIGRYRNLIILVGVLFLQVLGLAMQVKKSGGDEEKTRLIRIWAVGAVTPFERSLVWVQNSSGNLWHNYFYLRGVRAENRQLKEQIEHMRLEQVRLAEDAAQARRLQTLLAFKEQFISRTVAAQVIGSSGSDHSRIIYIDKGENAGIKRDMAVMTVAGIVGKVLLVYPSVAQVLLISDESSGVGALLEKTRLQGVLRGTANGEVVLERVMSDEQVPVGETVLTSGGDQIFPKGLPVGTVTKVGSGRDLFLNIKIKPAADLSQLEEVMVLVEKQERQATEEDAVRMRASDILAQRLPSVPDKPAADANPAATVPGNSGASAAATQPKSERKQPIGNVAKPQGLAGSAKPATTAKAGVAGSPATAVAKSGKNPSGTSIVHSPSPAGQSIQPAESPSTVPKATDGAGAPTTGAEPDPSQTNPPSAQPKPAKPSTPPQANSQPPADGNNPQ